ncbi:putative lipoprotein [Natrarchaeobaculum sulfurireducens]|uniref:Putative lipoprotein n=1 Tax=Natrarchaeobaculum sulfurireducens TaxID=2044521 RepID=A0A346PQC3_9EURY|nr:putative lipoprotein [Natrarchaeobaculum sulfurireducens]
MSRRRIIQISGGLVVLSSVGNTTTASSDHETNGQPADAGIRTRSAHFSPDAPDIDVYIDGELVREGISYRTVTDYRDLEPATYTIQVVPTGEDSTEAVLEETVEIEEGDSTLAAIGEVAAENQPLEALLLEDDNSPVDPDTARVRVVHVSPDAPAVDVVAGENGDTLFENVAFGESGYTEVPDGEYTLEIYPAGDRAASVYEIGVSLAGGAVYSAFAVGYLEPESAPADEPFEILLTEDSLPDEKDAEPNDEELKEDEPEKEPDEEEPKEDEPEKEPEKEPKEDEPEKEPEKEPKEDEPEKEPEKEPKEDEPEKEPEKEIL